MRVDQYKPVPEKERVAKMELRQREGVKMIETRKDSECSENGGGTGEKYSIEVSARGDERVAGSRTRQRQPERDERCGRI